MIARKFTAALAAMGIGIAPQVVAAQECITQSELEAMAIYAVPAMLDAAGRACGDTLSSNSFLLSGTGPMKAKYDSVRAGYWPLASSAMVKMIGGGGGDMPEMSMLTQLPENSVRPMIDALIVQELSSEIPADDCTAVDRIAQSLAPLDPSEFAGVFGAIMMTVMNEDGEETFCTDA